MKQRSPKWRAGPVFTSVLTAGIGFLIVHRLGVEPVLAIPIGGLLGGLTGYKIGKSFLFVMSEADEAEEAEEIGRTFE